LIALQKNGKPLFGVFNQPILDEFLIGDGISTELNGRKVEVRGCDSLASAVLLTTDHLNIERYQNLSGFENLMRNVRLYRQWGDCYGYYLVATGFADIMIDSIMNLWDKLALIPIIKGAGGTITNYQGGDPMEKESIVATSGSIHEEVIKILNSSN
ncbi:MAG: histidinol-phosphatase, partial [Melioribacteraceae bacterium]|nr:histidinol-phosphatase [Melioribacteraceae bacterium]